MNRTSLLLSFLIAAAPAVSDAATVTLATTGRGWIDSTGLDDAGALGLFNDNYLAGKDAGLEYRDFFVFAVPALASGDYISSATLNLYVPDQFGFSSPDGSETFVLHDVSTPSATLMTGGDSFLGEFDDLGSGVVYGEVVATSANLGTFLQITLNAAGLATLNTAAGGDFSLGGSISTLQGDANQYLFNGTRAYPGSDYNIFGAPHNTYLSVTVVPEAGVFSIVSAAAIAACMKRRRI